MAFTTEKMVYVVPMLATMSFLVSSLNNTATERLVDDSVDTAVDNAVDNGVHEDA